MLLIPCPWCGPRNEMEFSYGHEGHIARPRCRILGEAMGQQAPHACRGGGGESGDVGFIFQDRGQTIANRLTPEGRYSGKASVEHATK